MVTQLLRAMLYVHAVPSGTNQLRLAIERELKDRNDIAIRTKLLSLIAQLKEKPWAFPSCVNTNLCRKFYRELKPIADVSDKGSNFMSDPVSTSALSGGS